MIGAWILLLLSASAAADRPDFVRVPPGSFPGATFARPFEIGRTEVTVGQFAAFVNATCYRTAAERAGSGRNWRRPGFKVDDRQPVVYLTFSDAEAYCRWIGARLPTDAEWEYAARAGATGRHFWGEVLDDRYLWYRGNSDGQPQKVGRKLANTWGLRDVEGNVWEWTVSEAADGVPTANRRGGSWADCDEIDGGPLRTSSPLIGLSIYFKIPVGQEHRYDDIGFRCVRPTQ